MIMELLLQNGGEVNAVDGRKRTPLHYAAENDRADLCKMLRSRGAILTEDSEGNLAALSILCSSVLIVSITQLYHGHQMKGPLRFK